MILSEKTFGFLNPLIHLSCIKIKLLQIQRAEEGERKREHMDKITKVINKHFCKKKINHMYILKKIIIGKTS